MSAVTRREMLWAALQVVGAFVLLGAGVAMAAHFFHDPIFLGATWLMDRFGLIGMGIGVFVADGFHFPVPPQFYMLAAIAHGGNVTAALVVITVSSLLAGHAAFFFARRLSHLRFVRRGVMRVERQLGGWFARYGARALFIAGFLPVPYSFLCYLAGLQRVPYRAFLPVLLLRVPKVYLYFLIVRAGWAA